MIISVKHFTSCKNIELIFVSVFLSLVLSMSLIRSSYAESKPPISPQVDITFHSAEIVHFDKPLRIGVGKKALEYQDVLVLKVEVDREEYDSLPPSIEPFLYIGRHEYRTFHIDRDDQKEKLILTFHVRNQNELKENAPMVLTIDHRAPSRTPAKLIGPDTLRFSKKMIIDKR